MAIESKIKRPILVRIVAVTGWILVVFNFIYAFSPTVKEAGEFYPPVYSLIVCFQFISFVGIWYMKRWGIEIFVLSFFAKNILLLAMNAFSFTGVTFILSLLFVILLLFYYKSMDSNL
jgi:hypothetical protein